MTQVNEEPDERRVEQRVADRSPDEADVEDPEALARTVLEDSDIRTATRGPAPGETVEHRTSEDTVPPPDLPEP